MSAFAPISNPSNCPWGEKAFKGYFGEDDKSKWADHDATELVKKWKGPLDVLIDVVRAFPRSLIPCTHSGMELRFLFYSVFMANLHRRV